jgi:hypothetical protein
MWLPVQSLTENLFGAWRLADHARPTQCLDPTQKRRYVLESRLLQGENEQAASRRPPIAILVVSDASDKPWCCVRRLVGWRGSHHAGARSKGRSCDDSADPALWRQRQDLRRLDRWVPLVSARHRQFGELLEHRDRLSARRNRLHVHTEPGERTAQVTYRSSAGTRAIARPLPHQPRGGALCSYFPGRRLTCARAPGCAPAYAPPPRSCPRIGSERRRLPVAAKIALVTAGWIMVAPGSPMPPQRLPGVGER